MNIKFNSLYELYNRVKPALRVKQSEIKRLYQIDIMLEMIWQYNLKSKWLLSENLSLATMVDDIINSDNDAIMAFEEKKKMEAQKDEK